ncbi:MAG: YIP1 family protein [Rhodobacteraceae bacterium]|jgi:hypothetical protein|nr:YIP1 family protein [Paracoccaceae bacterium]
MDRALRAFSELLRATLADPRDGARRVLALRLPVSTRWQALAVVVALSVLFSQLTVRLFGAEDALAGLGASPLAAAAILGGLTVAMAGAIHAVGRAFGGRGRFEDALILVVWLHAVGFVLQLAQLAILLILPPLAQLVVLAGIALLFWLLTGFVAELHGFVSRVQVFVMILVTLLALSFALALVLGMLGIAPPEV